MHRPIFSFITCTFQCAPFIQRCYWSLKQQTIQDWEWVVVDDASTDNTQNIIEELGDPRIRLFRFEKNFGRGVARQYALKQAEGIWCAIIDMDDFCFPDRLEYAEIARISGYDYFCSAITLIDDHYSVKGVRRFITDTYPRSFPHASVCGNIDLFRTIGYSKFRFAEDQVMVLTLANNFNGFYCEEPLYVYHENASTSLKGAFLGNSYCQIVTLKMLRNGTLRFNSNLLKNLIKNIFKIIFLIPFVLYPKAYLWTLRLRDRMPASNNLLTLERINFIRECASFWTKAK